jgi:predicted DCC family thiol-disulfide oxidoreductase YuxK
MDSGGLMSSTKNLSAWQFAVFRVVFGLYLAWHFAALLPYAGELFSAQGVLPRYALNLTYKAFPDVLAFAATPLQAQVFIGVLLLCAISFGLGWWRRTCAVVLWYGWACLFNRNNLISNPGIPYVGVLLVFCALVPPGEPLALRGKPDPSWKMPGMIYWGAWFLLVSGYTYSGVWKALSPSWQDGSALHHLITNPLARPGFWRTALLALPSPILAGLTWMALAGELAALPLSICRSGRLITWIWMLAMHLGILLVVDFADLTLGMVMIHLFTFDPDWLRPDRAARPILLFDGECALCHGAVRFLSQEDTHEVLRYAPLQGRTGRQFLIRHQLSEMDSMVLIENPSTAAERAFTHSSAALRALLAIGGIWKSAGIALLIPSRFRDLGYQVVARRRYRWFGHTGNSCGLPNPRLRHLVLQD